ncbi:MAG: hypothetical protein QOE92_2564 [Chloroflexota bacterium]|jgi:hypothetical protein|nr:hypothetical protein [Chloroflexota bacterium]
MAVTAATSTGFNPAGIFCTVLFFAAILVPLYLYLTSRRGWHAVGKAYAGPGLAAIRAHDPAFDEARFLHLAQTEFLTLQEARSAGDLERARVYMGPDAYAAWRIQQEHAAGDGNRRVLGDLRLLDAAIMLATHDEHFDAITVMFNAKADDHVVDGAGTRLAASKGLRDWREYWTFMRSTAATTRPDGGLLERRCPNCGAPLVLNATAECEHCRAEVTNGAFDWVLSQVEDRGHLQLTAEEAMNLHLALAGGFMSPDQVAAARAAAAGNRAQWGRV